MGETEAATREEQTEYGLEQESVQTSDVEETPDAEETEAESAETEAPDSVHSTNAPESASQPETTVIADFGNLEELTAETNTLLTEQNELLKTASESLIVVSVLLGVILGMLAVVIFGGAMNHDHD